MPKPSELTCSDCGLQSCYRADKKFPPFCLTQSCDPAAVNATLDLYNGETQEARIARAAAEVEGTYYGKLTRVEEIIAFANRLGAHRIGIATCVGLMQEATMFARILKAHGLNPFTVICKMGAVDKTRIGIPEELKIARGSHESLCNPILQAKMLNEQKTDLNVVVGLCVGHDSLFIKYSDALVTTLITKDRVLAHNPAAALYTAGFYYKRLLAPEAKL
ncbi:MAG: DUF1847 domain-containing protein [Acidobacteriaceae bacterium]|nr:DUF1847 domain-containing protein [Acidobacteriaceae bacterium]